MLAVHAPNAHLLKAGAIACTALAELNSWFAYLGDAITESAIEIRHRLLHVTFIALSCRDQTVQPASGGVGSRNQRKLKLGFRS